MAETLREFLINIRYNVDGATEQRFNRGLSAATTRANLLGAAVAAAAVAVVTGVTRIAAAFDDMYYASQRTKASVENIKGLGYAVSQLGGSYQGTLQAIESFAQKLRSNPGYESLVKQLGVATQQNGKLRDTTAIIRDLAKALQTKPYYIQKQYFEALGLDERTVQALQSGELTGYIEEYRKKQQALGVDQEKAAAVGRDLTRAWRGLQLTLTTLGEKLMVDLAPSIERVVKGFDEFVVKHQDTITKIFLAMMRAAELVAAAFVKVAEFLSPLVKKLDELATAFTGEGALTVAMTAFALWLTTVWLAKILGAFGLLGSGFGAMLLRLGINPLTLGVGGALALSTTGAGTGEDEEIARRRAAPGGVGGAGGANKFDGTNAIKDERSWWQRTVPTWLGGKEAPKAAVASGGQGRGASNAPIRGTSFTQKAPGIINRLMADFGITREQAAGVMGNLGHESGGLRDLQEKNPAVPGSRGGYGWAQWTGPRRRAFEKWTAEKGLDPASDEANYGFLRHELNTTHKGAITALKKTNTVEDATTVFENIYEGADIKNYPSRNKWAQRALRASQAAAAAAASQKEGGPEMPPLARVQPQALSNIQTNAATVGSGTGTAGPAPLTPPVAGGGSTTSVDMQQKTEITVLGGGDPAATGAAVAQAQGGVNGTMLRNMQGAVR